MQTSSPRRSTQSETIGVSERGTNGEKGNQAERRVVVIIFARHDNGVVLVVGIINAQRPNALRAASPVETIIVDPQIHTMKIGQTIIVLLANVFHRLIVIVRESRCQLIRHFVMVVFERQGDE